MTLLHTTMTSIAFWHLHRRDEQVAHPAQPEILLGTASRPFFNWHLPGLEIAPDAS